MVRTIRPTNRQRQPWDHSRLVHARDLPKTVGPLTSSATPGELSRRSRPELAVQNLIGNSGIRLFPTGDQPNYANPRRYQLFLQCPTHSGPCNTSSCAVACSSVGVCCKTLHQLKERTRLAEEEPHGGQKIYH